MNFLPTVFAYLGPETMLPMTSVIAGAAGVVMMFGRSSIRWLTVTFRRFSATSRPAIPSRRIGTGPVGRIRERVRS